MSHALPHATDADRALIDQAARHLVSTHSPGGKRAGWLMIASVLIEAWDLYSIAFVLVFLKEIFHPSALMLGLVGAATQGGSVVGGLLGGWLSDRIGRRLIFLLTMVLFIVLAIAQGFAPTMASLAVIRFLLGIPLGSDISNGYTYIMELMPAGEREVMGNRWQLMFAVGQVLTLAVIAVFLVAHMPHDLLWRVVLALGAVPAAVLLFLRSDLPETAIWLIRNGRFREAKVVGQRLYNDPLAMLPDHDVAVPQLRARDVIRHLRSDPIRWRATLFSWIACFAQGSEFSTFAFYIPTLFVLVGVSGTLGTDLVTMALFSIASVSAFVGPMITPRIGQRGLSIAGFSITLAGLLLAAMALYAHALLLLPLACAVVLWGHYWDAENVMTIAAVVAQPGLSRAGLGDRLPVRENPLLPGDLPVPGGVRRDRPGHANATLLVCTVPAGGPAGRAVRAARNLHGGGED